MAEDGKKIGGAIDKLVMGIILGGAIGSVVGLTLAPRKGKETRAIIKEKGEALIEKGKEVSQDFVLDHKEAIAGEKYQIKKGRGFLRWLFSKKEGNEKMPKMSMDSDENDKN